MLSQYKLISTMRSEKKLSLIPKAENLFDCSQKIFLGTSLKKSPILPTDDGLVST